MLESDRLLAPIRLAYASGRGVTARAVAEFIARVDPEICAVAGIDAGDAFALATRFDRQWGYRGTQALFWQTPFAHAKCTIGIFGRQHYGRSVRSQRDGTGAGRSRP